METVHWPETPHHTFVETAMRRPTTHVARMMKRRPRGWQDRVATFTGRDRKHSESIWLPKEAWSFRSGPS